MTYFLYRTVYKYTSGHLTRLETGFWSGLWVAITTVSFIPEVTTELANLFGIGRGVDLLIYTAILILFYFCFRLYGKIEKIRSELTELVRELAISENDK
jgi:hypothetical protein